MQTNNCVLVLPLNPTRQTQNLQRIYICSLSVVSSTENQMYLPAAIFFIFSRFSVYISGRQLFRRFHSEGVAYFVCFSKNSTILGWRILYRGIFDCRKHFAKSIVNSLNFRLVSVVSFNVVSRDWLLVTPCFFSVQLLLNAWRSPNVVLFETFELLSHLYRTIHKTKLNYQHETHLDIHLWFGDKNHLFSPLTSAFLKFRRSEINMKKYENQLAEKYSFAQGVLLSTKLTVHFHWIIKFHFTIQSCRYLFIVYCLSNQRLRIFEIKNTSTEPKIFKMHTPLVLLVHYKSRILSIHFVIKYRITNHDKLYDKGSKWMSLFVYIANFRIN